MSKPMRTGRIIATKVPIEWRDEMSIYASEHFLRTVGDNYGWIGGVDSDGRLCCILPFTIIRKARIRMARFRVETISMCEDFDIQDEKEFLNSAMKYLRSAGADVVIPASTNTIFRTYPDGAIVAPYSSYIVDLTQPLNALWENLSRTYRKDIRRAEKQGVIIVGGLEYLKRAYNIISETFNRSRLPFMSYTEFEKVLCGLGDNMKLLVSEYKGVAQSCTAYHFSKYSAYAVHGGTIAQAVPGTMKYLQWEAIKTFRELGVQRFDFVGARVDPKKGSKQEGIMLFKQHLGGRPVNGFIWKYHINPLKSMVYSLAVRLLRGGDIVDAERHKLRSIQRLIDKNISNIT